MYQAFYSSLIFVFDDLLHDAYGRKEARTIGCIRLFVLLVFHEYASCFGKEKRKKKVLTMEEF